MEGFRSWNRRGTWTRPDLFWILRWRTSTTPKGWPTSRGTSSSIASTRRTSASTPVIRKSTPLQVRITSSSFRTFEKMRPTLILRMKSFRDIRSFQSMRHMGKRFVVSLSKFSDDVRLLVKCLRQPFNTHYSFWQKQGHRVREILNDTWQCCMSSNPANGGKNIVTGGLKIQFHGI